MKGTLWYTGFSPAQLEQIKTQFEGLLGEKIAFDVIRDPSLIGGFVAHVGGKAYDASFRSRLKAMRECITLEDKRI